MTRRISLFAALIIFAFALSILPHIATARGVGLGQNQALYVGNETCATCHQSIVQSYSRTPMALTSGIVGANLIDGSFTQKASSIFYRIYREGAQSFLSYERSGDAGTRGIQELDYFIGSGRRGRSYLSSLDGFLYESPASYYTQEQRWDISPGYESHREILFNRPIEPSCLYCHASQVKPIAGTQNRYESPPFDQGGIGCEQCHGPGGDHVKGRATMVNPANLSPARRDSVCEQCHLSGESRINQPGKNLSMFRPSDLLSDYVISFVYEAKSERASKAISHVEAMAQSRCKLRTGESMSCMSCHDPHLVPATEERSAYFRKKCLACHLAQNPSEGLQQHYAKNYDCSGCHMPKTPVVTIEHTTLTDHRIPRKASGNGPLAEPGAKLVQFGAKQSDRRGLALAYAEIAFQKGNPFYKDEAFRLLTEVLPSYSKDAEVLTRLGYLHQTRGNIDRAAALYESALQNEPHQVVAEVNLGVIYAKQGRVDSAMALWREALTSNPGLSEAGVNLAIAVWAKGEKMQARDLLQRVLRFNPEQGSAKRLLQEMH